MKPHSLRADVERVEVHKLAAAGDADEVVQALGEAGADCVWQHNWLRVAERVVTRRRRHASQIRCNARKTVHRSLARDRMGSHQ